MFQPVEVCRNASVHDPLCATWWCKILHLGQGTGLIDNRSGLEIGQCVVSSPNVTFNLISDSPDTCKGQRLLDCKVEQNNCDIIVLACTAFLSSGSLTKMDFFSVRIMDPAVLCPLLRIQQWSFACCLAQAVGPALSGRIADCRSMAML
jgi:hypothetical protein